MTGKTEHRQALFASLVKSRTFTRVRKLTILQSIHLGDYYDQLTVNVPVDGDTIEDYKKGETVQCTGHITTYFDREKKASKIIFTAEKVSHTVDIATPF